MAKNYQTLKVSLDQRGVLSVCLNRPTVRNAFNDEVIDDLIQAFSLDVTRPEVRIVVLRGEGTVFCAGGDLNWMKRSVDFNFEENLEETRKLSRMFSLLNECPKPVIGLIHGAAIGGGVGLVSICDKVIASADTQFSLSEVRLGIVPACIGPFVIAKIGASQARNLFITAQRFLAEQAKIIGLIHEVVSAESLLEEALENTLVPILQSGPQAVTVAKRLVLDLSWPEARAGKNDYLEYISRILAELRISPEGQEGLRAFLEKRKPSWMKK